MPTYLYDVMRRLQLGQIFHCNPNDLDDLTVWEASWYIELDNLKKKHEATRGV